VRFVLPALHSAADAPNAMAAIADGVGAGAITPAEAGELSRLIETYVTVLRTQNTLQKTGDAISSYDASDRLKAENEFSDVLKQIARKRMEFCKAEPNPADDSPNECGEPSS